MTFAAHGALGAGLTCAAISPLGPDPAGFWIFGVLGFIMGSLPDTADWFTATFLGAQRWVLYGRMHHGDLTWKFFWCPPFLLHVWADSFIHNVPGGNWWPRYAWTEFAMWGASGLLFWIAFA